MPRLSQADILEAVQDLLRKRGDMPKSQVTFRYKFGLIGDPMITLIGDAVDLPDAGQVYLAWEFSTVKGGTA